MNGRVSKKDVLQYLDDRISQDSDFNEDQSYLASNDDLKEMTHVQKLVAKHMKESVKTSPHVYSNVEVDVTDIVNFVSKNKNQFYEKYGNKLTFTPIFLDACVNALKEFPVFNCSLDHTGENLVIKDYINLGIAVDTPTGLVFPVITTANKKSILGLSKDLMDISERARSGKLKPDELKGGTFTISSLGGIGGTYFTPIINPPEVAIMVISKSVWRTVYNHNSKEIIPTFTMPFSLSYDNRVNDGAIGAAFTSFFSKALFDSKTFE